MDITFNNYKEYLQVNDFLEKKRIQLETVNLYNEMNSFINDNIVDLDDSSLYTEKAKEESKGFGSKIWNFLKTVWAKIVKLFDFIIKKLFKHDVKIKELEAKVKKLEQAKEENFEKAQFSDKDVADVKAAFKEEMKTKNIDININLDELADKVKAPKLDAQGKEEGKKKKTVFLAGLATMIKKLPKGILLLTIGNLGKNKSVDDLTVKGKTFKLDPKIKNMIKSFETKVNKNKKSNKTVKESTEYYSEEYGWAEGVFDIVGTILLCTLSSAVFLGMFPFWPVLLTIVSAVGLRAVIPGKLDDETINQLYTYSMIYYYSAALIASELSYFTIKLCNSLAKEEHLTESLKTEPSSLSYKKDIMGLINFYNNCKYINKETYEFYTLIKKDSVYAEFAELLKMVDYPILSDEFNFYITDIKAQANFAYKDIIDLSKNKNILSKLKQEDIKLIQQVSNAIMKLISQLANMSMSVDEFKKYRCIELWTNGLFSGSSKKMSKEEVKSKLDLQD